LTKKTRVVKLYYTSFFLRIAMGCFRALICIIFPPAAVIDKGCGAVLLTTILTCIGWVPGVIAAIFFNNQK